MQQLVDRLTRTRANYWLEPALDSALAWALLVEGLRRHVPWPLAALLFLAGVFAFSFMEYVVHRWVFHGPLQTFARGHAAHHRQGARRQGRFDQDQRRTKRRRFRFSCGLGGFHRNDHR